MRSKTSKRIRKNIMSDNPSQNILIEITNVYGERSKDFTRKRDIYQAAKCCYKNYRKSGNHDKAEIFLRRS